MIALVASHAWAQAANDGSTPATASGAPRISKVVPLPVNPAKPLTPSKTDSACPFAGQGLTVTLSKVKVDGATAVTPAEVAKVSAPYLGASRDLAVVCEVRDRVAALYIAKGFRLTRVDLPAQRISGGELHLQATEGFVSGINGDALSKMGPSAALARQYLSQAVGKRPTPWGDIERAVLLTRDIPGAEIGIRLHAVRGLTGGVELQSQADNRRRFDLSTGFQFLGSQELGRGTLYARADANSLTRYGDRTSVVVLGSTNLAQKVVEFTESGDIGASGLRGEAEIDYSLSNPKGALSPLKISGDFLSIRTGLVYPFIRSQSLDIVGATHFEYIDQNNDLGLFQSVPGGGPTLFIDHLRIVTVQVETRWRPETIPALAANLRVELRQGLQTLGASHAGDANLSRDGVEDATVVRADGSVRWTFRGSAVGAAAPWIEVRGSGQWANNSLLAYEQFQIGNYTLGRGYEPGAASGDRAIGGQIEAAWPLAFHLTRRGALFRVEPYAFYDTAYLKSLGPAGFSTRILSAGAGARLQLPFGLFLDAAYANPLVKPLPGSTKPPDRLIFTLNRAFSFR